MICRSLTPATLISVLFAVGGVVFHHLYARRVEIDFIVLRLISIFITGCLAFLYGCMLRFQLPLGTSLGYLLVAITSFVFSCSASILVYRAHFHRLRHIPGPYLARLSALWTVREASGGFRFHARLRELHQTYGDVVRIGPRLVSVARADALPQTSALGKATFWGHAGADNAKAGFALSRDQEDHRVRRRPWELAFSPTQMVRHDVAIQDTIGLWLSQLPTEKPVDITAAVSRVTFDVMGVVGFGRAFGAVEGYKEGEGEEHPALKALRSAHAVLGSLRFVPWLMNLLGSLPAGGGGSFAPFLKLCEGVMKESQAERRKTITNSNKQEDKDHKDDIGDYNNGEKQGPKSVFSFLLDAIETKLPSAAPTDEALSSESRSIIAAGADTTQSALTNALVCLAAHPRIQQALQEQIDRVFPGGSAEFSYVRLLGDADTLAWIDSIINETLRLLPPGPSANPRVTAPKGLTIPKGEFGPRIWIPGDVEILQAPYVIQRDERWFERANEFVPERWRRMPEGKGPRIALKCERSAFFPFHLGKHACVGKPLAVQELRSVLARVVLGFDVALAPDEDWTAFQEKIQDHFTMTLPPLRLILRMRTHRICGYP
ncbi:cytochrome P450 [Xylariales sp. AK1849]|nr:cytochrome P450 [Xylariales sp. AK1849]